jgi:hypothetical protein
MSAMARQFDADLCSRGARRQAQLRVSARSAARSIVTAPAPRRGAMDGCLFDASRDNDCDATADGNPEPDTQAQASKPR